MYSYDINTQINGTPISLQVVWVDHDDSNDQLAARIEQLVESYNRRLPPTRLLFVCAKDIENGIRTFFEEHDDLEGRLKSISHISVAPFDKTGKVLEEKIVHVQNSENEVRWIVGDGQIQKYARSAVGDVFDRTETILHAPHGYYFRKPSGGEEDIFVHAGNMLREPASLPVFNYLLLCKLPEDCHIIYIDSFTILSFALGLKSLIRYFHKSDSKFVAPTIESIHSYEVSSEFRVPSEKNYLVLISASTSGGLAQKLIKENGASPERIVHLLGVAPEDEGSQFQKSCVYFKPRPQPNMKDNWKDVIEIKTEEFLIAQGPPRSVRISYSHHVNKVGARELWKNFYLDAFKFHEPLPNHSAGSSTFSIVAGSTEPQCWPIGYWIDQTLVHEIPASACAIIHLDDDLSFKVSDWIAGKLSSHVAVKSFKQLEDQEFASDSIVVVAFQDHRLEGLRQVNMALRSHKNSHRHYILCYAFPSSGREYERLKRDLCMGPKGSRYGWSEFLVLPIGDEYLHESLDNDSKAWGEEVVDQHRSTLGDALTKILCARHSRSEIGSDDVFLPDICGQPLKLRPGSVFFEGEGANTNVSQVAVYAMVAAAMQAARERHPKSDTDIALAFDENPFVRSVLDPSMFARFNDGILQASLLRSARQAELDYSASEDLSGQFKAICLSVLNGRNHDVGEASLEFVYALATNKVSLREVDYKWLCDTIASDPVLHSVWILFTSEQDWLPGEG